ncbi:MAG: glycosyltransferase family 39 protein [Bacteroidetes bacterium]|nr:glycosyltransferase family 39 protein [Bacteroidota bacterium]
MIKRKSVQKVLMIAGAGLALRIIFILVVAKFYFDRENIFVSGDTTAWTRCFENLWKTGTYTVNPSSEFGYFGRMPGYSFFMGIFYFLAGQSWEAAYPVIGWFQSVLDFFGIVLVYKIGERIFSDKKTAAILALLYATYPFIIVWTPVSYSEYMSIFILLSGIYFFLCEEKKYSDAFSGFLIGLAVLFRPQVILLVPVLGVWLLIKNRKKGILKRATVFAVFFLLSYSPWPIRNYVSQHKIILTQDLGGFANYDKDVMAFMQYVYSVKGEWEPQFSDIIKNREVTWPRASYLEKDDSIKLNRAVYLSKNCGSGFSAWTGYWKEKFSDPNCNDEIKQLFDELRNEQIKNNAFHFWVTVPLQNFQKAVFKTTLNDHATAARKMASLLFIYRTLLILIGLAGCYFLFRSDRAGKAWGLIIFVYFIFVYAAICAGTGAQLRNIEIRYFLHADILLLIPAAFGIHEFMRRFSRSKKIQSPSA